MKECCPCTCNPNCENSVWTLPDELLCDGDDAYGIGHKGPDCPDGSDENADTCCRGDYEGYGPLNVKCAEILCPLG